MKNFLLILLRCYKFAISPWLGRSCRFYPSCSEYALEAVEKYGARKGAWLAVKRVSCCHPWHRGGYHPVP